MKRVLVCVLDWGLGHATRSVPVINELLKQGAEVFIASSGNAGTLLKMEFPALTYHELPGYRPVYASGGLTMTSMFRQLPKFYGVVADEHREVEKLVKRFMIHAVISDNRYGCYADKIPSVLITHQEVVRLMPGMDLLERMVNGWLQRYLNKYGEIWVPDEPRSGLTERFVSGKRPVRYVGWLSRFPMGANAMERIPLMAVVSGPEPQRSFFEQRLRQQLKSRPGRSLLVTGQPDKSERTWDGNVEVVSHLPALEMEANLLAADLVITRSGYSTIMDMIALGKRAAFVPTPGQPEQTWLADHLKENRIAFCQDQQTFTIDTLVSESARYTGWNGKAKSADLLKSAINQLMSAS